MLGNFSYYNPTKLYFGIVVGLFPRPASYYLFGIFIHLGV